MTAETGKKQIKEHSKGVSYSSNESTQEYGIQIEKEILSRHILRPDPVKLNPDEQTSIVIIGTYVIPEFPFAIIIASVAIGVMIASMRMTRSKIK